MPLVRIDLPSGIPADTRNAVGEVVYDAMIEALNVPADDRFQVIAEHPPGGLVLDPTYLGIARSAAAIIIQVTLNEGRSVEQKKGFYKAVAEGLQQPDRAAPRRRLHQPRRGEEGKLVVRQRPSAIRLTTGGRSSGPRQTDRGHPMRTRVSHYGWIVAAVTFLVLLVGAGIRATPGVLIVPLETGIRLVGRHDQRRGRDQHPALRPARAVRRRDHGALRPAPDGRAAPCSLLAVGVALDDPDPRRPGSSSLLWGVVVGSGTGMIAHGPRRHGRQPLVRQEPRPCARRAHRQQRHGPARLPAAAREPRGTATAGAPSRSTVGGRRAGARAARDPAPARPSGRPRPAALWRHRHRAAPGHDHNPAMRALLRLARRRQDSRDFWLLSGSFFICGASTNGLIGTHLIPGLHRSRHSRRSRPPACSR